MSRLHRAGTDDALRQKWEEIHREESADVIFKATKLPPKRADYDSDGSFQKVVKKYGESLEFETHRVMAVAPNHLEAQKLLLEHYKGDRGE